MGLGRGCIEGVVCIEEGWKGFEGCCKVIVRGL